MKFCKRLTQGIVFLSLLFHGASLMAQLLVNSTVHICEDDAQWPPYSYYKFQNTQVNNEIIGYSIDVIKHIFSKHNIQYDISFLPWKRCLEEVKTGKQYQMALNASFSEHRDQTYLMTKPYYSTQKYYYYSLIKYPNGLTITDVKQLKDHQLGGIRGHSFESYGINNNQVIHRTKGYVELIHMLIAGRFDVFLAEHEVILGQANINTYVNLEKPLAYGALNNLKKNEFHMLISRHTHRANDLKSLLDKGIDELQKSGQSKQFLQNYFN